MLQESSRGPAQRSMIRMGHLYSSSLCSSTHNFYLVTMECIPKLAGNPNILSIDARFSNGCSCQVFMLTPCRVNLSETSLESMRYSRSSLIFWQLPSSGGERERRKVSPSFLFLSLVLLLFSPKANLGNAGSVGQRPRSR